MPRVRSNGIELYDEEAGRGEPLVLAIGLGAQIVVWHEDFVASLADRDFRVISSLALG